MHQTLESDFTHFTSRGQKSQHPSPWVVFYFSVRNKLGICPIDALIYYLQFHKGEKWQYNPIGIISAQKTKTKVRPYMHNTKLVMEMMINKDKWEEVEAMFPLELKDPKVEPRNSIGASPIKETTSESKLNLISLNEDAPDQNHQFVSEDTRAN